MSLQPYVFPPGLWSRTAFSVAASSTALFLPCTMSFCFNFAIEPQFGKETVEWSLKFLCVMCKEGRKISWSPNQQHVWWCFVERNRFWLQLCFFFRFVCLLFKGFSASILLNPELSRRLLEMLPNPPESLLFRASNYGFSGEKFHRYCNDRGSTVVIARNSENIIFGGFSVPSWEHAGRPPPKGLWHGVKPIVTVDFKRSHIKLPSTNPSPTHTPARGVEDFGAFLNDGRNFYEETFGVRNLTWIPALRARHSLWRINFLV